MIYFCDGAEYLKPAIPFDHAYTLMIPGKTRIFSEKELNGWSRAPSQNIRRSLISD
jgi:hypothetical protein